jgi:hypothetical protein
VFSQSVVSDRFSSGDPPERLDWAGYSPGFDVFIIFGRSHDIMGRVIELRTEPWTPIAEIYHGMRSGWEG